MQVQCDTLIELVVFLCSTENHILEDVNKCVIALQEKDVDGLDRTAGAIRGRAARVVHVVTCEMDNYEPGVYTEKVLEATKLLTNTGTRRHLVCSLYGWNCDMKKTKQYLRSLTAYRLVGGLFSESQPFLSHSLTFLLPLL